MKNIHTLVPDIHTFLQGRDLVDPAILSLFTERIRKVFETRHLERPKRLSMSMLGDGCNRRAWAKIHDRDSLEIFDGTTLMKFTYGHMIEQLVLFLAEQAGHTVTGLQTEVNLGPVPGSRDAIIDGMLVDVKSASKYAFIKFKKGLKPEQDDFGYLKQLQGYLEASQDDPLLLNKNECAFLVICKETGELHLDYHKKSSQPLLPEAEEKYKITMDEKNMPERGYSPVPEGAAGNMKLGVSCSYCQFKEKCWPGLRTFLYSNGPVYLTKVVKEPKVEELKR
jgi:hypothetical protein